MARAIKLFPMAQHLLRTTGIYSNQSESQSISLNRRNFVFFTFLALIFLLAAGFSLFEAQTNFEYGLAFNIMVAGLTVTAIFIVTIWKQENIFELIEKLENFIESGKSNQNFDRFPYFPFNRMKIIS